MRAWLRRNINFASGAESAHAAPPRPRPSFATELFHLYFSYGITVGVGYSFSFSPSVIIIASYFAKRRALATGLAVAGSGVGTFAMAPITQGLLDAMGWRDTLRVLAGVSFVTIFVCGCTYAPLMPSRGLRSALTGPLFDPGLIRDVPFVLMCTSVAVGAWGYTTPFVHLVKVCPPPVLVIGVPRGPLCLARLTPVHCRSRPPARHRATAPALGTPPQFATGDAHVDPAAAALLISYLGIASTCGRVLLGRIGDSPRVSRLAVYQFSMSLCGLSLLLLPFSTSQAPIVVFSIVYGLFAGSFIALMPVIVTDLVGVAKLPAGLGLMYTVQTATSLLGAPSAGWLYDASGDYRSSFVVSGCTMLLAALILAFVPAALRRRRPPPVAVSSAAAVAGS